MRGRRSPRCQIRESRQTSLGRQRVNGVEKLLQALESVLAFERDQRFTPSRPRVPPSRRDRSLGVGDVANLLHDETRLFEQPLVAARGDKQIKTDRASDPDLL